MMHEKRKEIRMKVKWNSKKEDRETVEQIQLQEDEKDENKRKRNRTVVEEEDEERRKKERREEEEMKTYKEVNLPDLQQQWYHPFIPLSPFNFLFF